MQGRGHDYRVLRSGPQIRVGKRGRSGVCAQAPRPRPTPGTNDEAYTRSSHQPSRSRPGSTQAARRPTRPITRLRAARIGTGPTPWYAGSPVPGGRRTAGPSRSRAKRRPEETPPEPTYQIVIAAGCNGPGLDHAGVRDRASWRQWRGVGQASCRASSRYTIATLRPRIRPTPEAGRRPVGTGR